MQATKTMPKPSMLQSASLTKVAQAVEQRRSQLETKKHQLESMVHSLEKQYSMYQGNLSSLLQMKGSLSGDTTALQTALIRTQNKINLLGNTVNHITKEIKVSITALQKVTGVLKVVCGDATDIAAAYSSSMTTLLDRQQTLLQVAMELRNTAAAAETDMKSSVVQLYQEVTAGEAQHRALIEENVTVEAACQQVSVTIDDESKRLHDYERQLQDRDARYTQACAQRMHKEIQLAESLSSAAKASEACDIAFTETEHELLVKKDLKLSLTATLREKRDTLSASRGHLSTVTEASVLRRNELAKLKECRESIDSVSVSLQTELNVQAHMSQQLRDLETQLARQLQVEQQIRERQMLDRSTEVSVRLKYEDLCKSVTAAAAKTKLCTALLSSIQEKQAKDAAADQYAQQMRQQCSKLIESCQGSLVDLGLTPCSRGTSRDQALRRLEDLSRRFPQLPTLTLPHIDVGPIEAVARMFADEHLTPGTVETASAAIKGLLPGLSNISLAISSILQQLDAALTALEQEYSGVETSVKPTELQFLKQELETRLEQIHSLREDAVERSEKVVAGAKERLEALHGVKRKKLLQMHETEMSRLSGELAKLLELQSTLVPPLTVPRVPPSRTDPAKEWGLGSLTPEEDEEDARVPISRAHGSVLGQEASASRKRSSAETSLPPAKHPRRSQSTGRQGVPVAEATKVARGMGTKPPGDFDSGSFSSLFPDGRPLGGKTLILPSTPGAATLGPGKRKAAPRGSISPRSSFSLFREDLF